ncbi:UvrD-helicase domain-containing protein (plasmid) [Haloarcula sp. KBTZ06]|uniref:UvrD-helicase domain-containing protein n=1 Tax=Haloarcula sp. KBTZ06 TaxID=3402682 RepID=UPI003B42EF4C
MDLEQASTWDEYNRILEEKRNSNLFSLLPGPLKNAFYGDVVNKIDQADSRRTTAEDKFQTLKTDARTLMAELDDQLHGPRRRGDQLPQTAIDTVPKINDTRAELVGLAQEHTQFLTAAEQSTIEDLTEELDKLAAYLNTKREFDGAIAEIQTSLDELADDIRTACDGESLLSIEQESGFRDRSNEIQNWLETLESDFTDTPLTTADLQTLEQTADHLVSLRKQFSRYNEQVVDDQYQTVAASATALAEKLDDELQDSQTQGDPLPQSADSYCSEVDQAHQSISTLETPRAKEELTPNRQELLADLRTRLQRHREFITTKHTFDTEIETLLTHVEGLNTKVKHADHRDSYLTTPEEHSLTQEVGQVAEQLKDLTAEIEFGRLAQPDQQQLHDIETRLDDLQREISQYNQRFVERKRNEYEQLFSGFGDDDLALNEEQELAVYRNDIHNQVIAGAGTGKTFSLSCRVKYLVEEGISEDDILTLTFTRKAADEMAERLEEMFDITGVETATLHSFGNRVLNEVDPTLVQIEDQSRLREVGRLIRELRASSGEFQQHYEQFVDYYKDENLEDDDHKRQDFVDSLRYKSDTTLRGEEVTSRFDEEQAAHTAIADWLFKHQFTYRYRQYAAWAENPDAEAYVPDFTLPELDVYIEYLPSEATNRRKRWYEKKPTATELDAIYDGTDKTLLVVDGDRIGPDRAPDYIADQLQAAGVAIESPLRGTDLRDTAYEHNILWRDIESHFAEFVKKAKTNQRNPAEHLGTLNETDDPELYHFSHAATRVLELYDKRYAAYNAYDFVDMIVKATQAIKRGDTGGMASFEHVMVDEFQDLNLVQIEFIQALLTRHDDARLFAVGDDWQSIYGFKGARPDYFIDFKDHFPPATETRLETNYRCPPSVVQAGNALIRNNEAKTSKTVTANKSLKTTPRVHLVPGTDDFQYRRNAITKIVRLVTESLRGVPDREPGDVMILARNQEGSPFIRDISAKLQDRDIPVGGPNGVEVTTAHQSKGKEAEHVIIANAANGLNDGFPPTEGDRNLTNLVEIDTGSHLDEERRLFYVALTRAEEQLDIQSRATEQSPFLSEIKEHINAHPTGVDCETDRSTVTVTVEDEREAEPYWETRQIGEIITESDYSLKFAITDDAVNQPLLDKGKQYRLEDVKIGEYDGQPQLQIDTETAVILDPAAPKGN